MKLINYSSFSLIIDGISGDNLNGKPLGDIELLINWENDHKAPILMIILVLLNEISH